ncbi:GHKL domain-containing protein [Enterococcus rotai]|uniref:GHKL domain-containing protein n=1 Tax=Enterococcus rotai TaxID=118060 RepID=UPI0035C6B6E0
MESYLATELFAINYLQIVWALLHKKYIDTKQSIVLSILLASIISICFFVRTSSIFILLFIFYVALAIFIIRFTGNWILMSLTLFLTNSLVIISWLFTYDLLNFLFQLNYLDVQQLQMLVPFSLICQQIGLFLLTLVVKKVDKTYLISDSILHIPKSYKFQSMIALFFLIIFSLLKQLAVQHFFVESFFYLTFLLLTLNLIVYTTAYSYSKYYQEQLKKDVLFEQYNQELEKITVSDEFRHDYRNILLSLADYLEQDQSQKALTYIASITDYSKDILEEDPYAELGNISIPSVQGLLLYLIEHCDTQKIKLRLNIPNNIEENEIQIRLIDFLHCLSVLSEYAIKESQKGEEKNLYVLIKKEEHQLYINLTNATRPQDKLKKTAEKSINLKKFYKKHGLTSVVKTIHQYEGAIFSLQFNEGYFSVILAIPIFHQKTASRVK